MKKYMILGTIAGILVSAGLVLSSVRATDFELRQEIGGYDCSHTTLENGNAMNDPRCGVFNPSMEDFDSNNGRPVIRGVYDAVHSTGFRAFFAGRWYTAGVDSQLSVNANLWTLNLSGLDPPLLPGDYPIQLEMTDLDHNTVLGNGTITVPPVPNPTIYPVEWVGGRPIVRGTFSAANTRGFRVSVGSRWYVLGEDSELTANGDNWVLNLTNLAVALGEGSYDVQAEATTYAGQVLVDSTTGELVILPATILNIISHPFAGPLVNTGQSLFWGALLGVSLMFAGIYLLRHKKLRKDRRARL